MNGSQTNTAQGTAAGTSPKVAAKQCFLAADRFIKDARYREARLEIEKARRLDPANTYIPAFLDRIAYFEQQQKKERGNVSGKETPALHPSPQPAPSSAAGIQQKIPAAPKPAPVHSEEHPQAPHIAIPKPAPAPVHFSPASQPPVVGTRTEIPPIAPAFVPEEQMEHGAKSAMDVNLQEMKRQIQMLTHALEQEKKAREEMTSQHVHVATTQLRTALEQSWVNGAPNEQETIRLHELAVSLAIPDEAEQTILREVKLKMYSTAVKEVLSKRRLLRSSSSTMEWLRKVYQISMSEYLEYETKFLLDLIADQYKGTVLYVAPTNGSNDDLTRRLKTAGFAVVRAASPEEALGKIEKIYPNLILCQMEFAPGSLSGIKFLHLIRSTNKYTFLPFILICTTAEAGSLQSSELRPHEGFIQSPVDFDELIIVLNEKLLQLRDQISSLS